MRPVADRFRATATGLGFGLLLGPLDLLAQRALPYPWANLANSSAVWALAAFALGRRVGRRGGWYAAVAGVALLVTAVESYYVAAIVVLNDSPQILTSAPNAAWLVFALAAGAGFANAGRWSRDGSPLRAGLGTAAGAAVVFAEALVLLWRPAEQGMHTTQTVVLELVLGVGVLLLCAPSRASRLRAVQAAPLLSVVGFFAFLAAGFGQ